MEDCEFCDELQGLAGGRFASLYPDLPGGRIVLESDHFVVMPTIGQIFAGSMLVLPKEHIETSARIPSPRLPELTDIVAYVVAISRQWGSPVIFEHGALSCTGGSCGIYHAHIHVVPLPQPVSAAAFLPSTAACADSLVETLQALVRSNHYLLFGDERDLRFGDVGDLGLSPPSQYFRRMLADRFDAVRSWDWRGISAPEPDLLRSLAAYGGGHAAERPTYPA